MLIDMTAMVVPVYCWWCRIFLYTLLLMAIWLLALTASVYKQEEEEEALKEKKNANQPLSGGERREHTRPRISELLRCVRRFISICHFFARFLWSYCRMYKSSLSQGTVWIPSYLIHVNLLRVKRIGQLLRNGRCLTLVWVWTKGFFNSQRVYCRMAMTRWCDFYFFPNLATHQIHAEFTREMTSTVQVFCSEQQLWTCRESTGFLLRAWGSWSSLKSWILFSTFQIYCFDVVPLFRCEGSAALHLLLFLHANVLSPQP